MKNILAPLNGSDGDGRILNAAAAVAQRFNGHIDALFAAVDPRDAVPFLGEGASGALIQQIMEAAQRDAAQRRARARASYEAWLQRSGIKVSERPGMEGASVSWHEAPGVENELVGRRGRLADLIVVAQPAENGAIATTVLFEAALLDTGRPVLVAPLSGAVERFDSGPMVIAWNGSIEAARAIAAAKPLFVRTGQVLVLAVEERGRAAETEPVLRYLGWHGVKAETLTPPRKGEPTGASILAATQAAGAGLLVMGAYTHSRLRRMVFGGATEHVLTNTAVPVLMVH